MDIVVTIIDKYLDLSKINDENFELEWTIKKRNPKELEIGDRVYITQNRLIRCSAAVSSIDVKTDIHSISRKSTVMDTVLILKDFRWEKFDIEVKIAISNFKYRWFDI